MVAGFGLLARIELKLPQALESQGQTTHPALEMRKRTSTDWRMKTDLGRSQLHSRLQASAEVAVVCPWQYR